MDVDELNADYARVDPSDLHTVLRAFYLSEPLHSQAEFRAADRLNAALDSVGWAYDPRDPREVKP